jgi:AbiV family abortive infection protein
MARTDPLTLDQLAELARKSLDNALDLLDESDGLIAFGKFPRGYSVAILAGEEFGKFMMCQGAVGNLPGDEVFWRSFWKRFSSHDEKAVNFTSMVGHVVEDDEQRRWFMENLEKHVEVDQARKFAGLYVDVALDGTVIAPREAIDSDWAKGVAYVLGTFIRSHAEMWEGVDFHDVYREAQSGARQMVEALRTGDPDTIAATWDSTLGRQDAE